MYDVVVVGARCAGASAALLFARRGYRVLLADRATLPAETMSTLYIHQPGIARLAGWGVLDRLVSTGCPRLDTVTYQLCDTRLSGRLPQHNGVDCAFAPRRHVLDQLLVDAAVEAGADFANGHRLTSLSEEDGRVTGVTLTAASGTEVTARARLVVGADGMTSRVAHLVGAETLSSAPRHTCVFYSAWSGVDTGFGFIERPGSWIATIPTHDQVTLVATYFPQHRFAELRRDALGEHLSAIRETAPALSDQLAGAERTDRLRGTGNQLNFFRRAHGPGWVLLGDAGHHRDSITAQGISNALLQADLLDQAVGYDLRDPEELDRALTRFASARDEQLMPTYRGTLELAKLQVPASRLDMMRTISATPALSERYLAVLAGVVSMNDFLTPELAELL